MTAVVAQRTDLRTTIVTATSLSPEPRPSLGEEIANSVSHGVGLVAVLVAGPFLIARAAAREHPWGTICVTVFAATMVVMYLASTIYHALPLIRAKQVFRTLEHSAIFLLIAGTYTPFTLVTLRGAWGWTLFGLVWTLAVVGIVLKSVATTRYRWLPGVLYLAMAWLIVIAIRPLSLHVPYGGLMWLLCGGIAYTVGMAFFAARRIPYCHFVWHLFVLAGTSCHFVAVWRYVV
jgi:hemolysin III